MFLCSVVGGRVFVRVYSIHYSSLPRYFIINTLCYSMGKHDGCDDCHSHANAAGSSSESGKPKGWNYSAIAIMLMFVLPGLLAVALQV
jgi:hypothetical protein